MAKARPRYVVTHEKMCINGHNMKDTRFVLISPCGYAGRTKTKDGKKLLKRDLSYFMLRFEDRKQAKAVGLPSPNMSVSAYVLKTFFTIEQ